MNIAVKERKPRVRLEEPAEPPKVKKRPKNDKLTMRLSERAILVDLDVGVWSASITDKEVSQEARAARKAEREAGSFRKHLVARKALEAIRKAISKMTTKHKNLTLPWSNNGMRILKAETYEEWSREMRLGKAEFEKAVEAFITVYEGSVRADAKRFLGKMFKESDYPAAKVVRSKFYVKLEVMPVPESGDFRAKLGNREVAILVKDLEAKTRERMQAAVDTVYEKVAEVVGKMFDKLSTYKPSPGPYQESAEGIFRDTLVTNVRELADLIPALNITNDPVLENFRVKMLQELCVHEPKVLRKDANVRARTAKAAKAIYDKAAAFIA